MSSEINKEEVVMKKQQFILGTLCALLPFASIGFGLIGAFRGYNNPNWWYSISATFYANSNIIMIGLLFATTVYFWAYKGYDLADNIITKISSICSIGIISFPCQATGIHNYQLVGLFCIQAYISQYIHYTFAIGLYTTFVMMLFRFRKTDGSMTEKKKLRNKYYLILGIIMCISISLIPIKLIFSLKGYWIIIGEVFAQICFGMAWLIKAGKFKYLND